MMKMINVVSFIIALVIWAVAFVLIVPSVRPNGGIGGEAILVTMIGAVAFMGIRCLLNTIVNDILEIINNNN